jgi:hypothetical protein
MESLQLKQFQPCSVGIHILHVCLGILLEIFPLALESAAYARSLCTRCPFPGQGMPYSVVNILEDALSLHKEGWSVHMVLYLT